MARIYSKVLTECFHCPDYYGNEDSEGYRVPICWKTNKPIRTKDIPKWCPLPVFHIDGEGS